MKTLRQIMLPALCMLVACGTLRAQEPVDTTSAAAAFEAEYDALMKQLNIAGVSIAVVKDNDIVYTHAFGKKNRSTGEDLDSGDIIRVASISKPVLAAAIMQLQDNGMLDITEDAGYYLPFKLRNPRYPDKPVTLEMIMSHTSSLNDSQGASSLFAASKSPYACFSSYAPGEGFQYCNYNATLMAAAIEKASGMRFDQYVLENILDPLEAEGAFCVDDLDASKFATVYTWSGAGYQPNNSVYTRPSGLENYKIGEDVPRLSPAGGLKITAPGLARFMMMLMDYGKSPLSEYRIMSEESARDMQRPRTGKVGAPGGQQAALGLVHNTSLIPGDDLIGHVGIAFGVRAGMYFEPEKKYGFVVLCNGTTTPSIVEKTIPILYKHFIKEE